MKTRFRAATAGVVLAAALLATGCAGGGPKTAPSPAASTHASIQDLVTPTPTPTVTTPATAEPVAGTLDAGPVAEGAPATVSGTGPANVTYQRQGEFAVVIGLDCTGCTGTAAVTAPGRMSPFGRAAAPMNGSFLMDVLKDDPADQMLIVQAEGSWTVTLTSWNDLPYVSGPQQGTGPAVLFFSDDVAHVSVDYTPAGADDSFSGRVFTTSAHPQLFGDSGAFSKVFDADLPGVMAIQTNGSWTVTPTP